MPELTIDIAGFYYSTKVEIDESKTFLDAMNAASQADLTAPKGSRPVLEFTTESLNGKVFIDGISVYHPKDPASRQDPRRTYAAGLYEYFDDDVLLTPGGGFEPANPNTPYVLAWQYYAYDAEGRDADRAGQRVDRKVVPFSEQTIGTTTLLVWRLVAIFLRPSYRDSLKVARARLTGGA